MANAFDVLARDHEEVKRTLSELELGTAGPAVAAADRVRDRATGRNE
jgi:hypothetical protein